MVPDGAETLRRRSYYANSRSLQWPRHRWVRPLSPRHRPRPGAAAGTMAAGIIIITALVAPASSSAARPITAADMAAATRGAWLRPLAARAGGWWTAATDLI